MTAPPSPYQPDPPFLTGLRAPQQMVQLRPLPLFEMQIERETSSPPLTAESCVMSSVTSVSRLRLSCRFFTGYFPIVGQ